MKQNQKTQFYPNTYHFDTACIVGLKQNAELLDKND